MKLTKYYRKEEILFYKNIDNKKNLFSKNCFICNDNWNISDPNYELENGCPKCKKDDFIVYMKREFK